ncbi:MAG TPA: 30S ribosomal protein S6 [Candidatus Saccharibacteria bacterium]|jgi:small subunit ribosomal protein S6|nr:30S ribosomal protein S6 [Candidatus Saccharibacteria bacterium]HMR38516.1 30S ribosomal protein S6 [Candidatus Saccharibacteria bacterium]
MNEYELTVLIHPDLETDLEAPLIKVQGIIKDAGGKIVKEDNQGKKKLAYQINRQHFAVFVYFDLELPSDAPLKISNTLNITDGVLRYLLVKADAKVNAALAAANAKEDE